jgi:hypothetical protein
LGERPSEGFLAAQSQLGKAQSQHAKAAA